MYLGIALLILAVGAAILAFELIATTITSVALVLFWVFLGLFLLDLLYRLMSGHWVFGRHV